MSLNTAFPKTIPIFMVDAFSRHVFGGNGAAICFLNFQQVIPTNVMQKIAAEMNLSETAFVSILNAGDSFLSAKRFGLRWFTPTNEVPLCGHATMATAAVLFTQFKNSSDVIEFETVSGTLASSRLSSSRFSIDLPAYESECVDPVLFAPMIRAAIGTLPFNGVFLSSSGKLLIQLKSNLSRQKLEEIKPSFHNLLSATPEGAKILGVIVTMEGCGKSNCIGENGEEYDFISRYFAPWLGISEDPVTGSAHAVLGPFWAKVLNKTEFFARQCSPRGGELNINVLGNRVQISGEAVIVLKGEFILTE